MDRAHFRECLREMLSEMFGTDTVTETIRGEKLDLVVSEKAITVDLVTLVARIFLFACQGKLEVCSVMCIIFFQEVKCDEDETLQTMIQSAVKNFHRAVTPIKL